MQFSDKLRVLTNGAIDKKEVKRGIAFALKQCETAAKAGNTDLELVVKGNTATIRAKVAALMDKGLRASWYVHTGRHGYKENRLKLAW